MLIRILSDLGTSRRWKTALAVLLGAIIFVGLSAPTEAARGGTKGKPRLPAPTPIATATPSPTSTPALSAPVFTAQTPPTTATAGAPYSYQFRATGNPAPSFALYSGSLPSGLALSAGGLLSGTPNAAGAFSFRVRATNSQGTAFTGTLTVSVSTASSAPVFTAQTPPTTATIGSWYSYQFRASGNPTPIYGYSGSLPPGLTLNSTTGVLAGTPTTGGTFSFWASASNSAGTDWTSSISIAAAGSTFTTPTFTAQTPPTNATVGTAYSYQFRASGNPTPTYALYSGSLPPGLGLNATTGLVSGTPSAAGTFSFRVRATNSQGTAVTATITIAVGSTGGPLAFEPIPQPLVFQHGQSVSYQFRATGGSGPYRYYQSAGTLPGWLSLSSTGLLSGELMAWPGSDFYAYITVTDAAGGRETVVVWIRVAP